jgi:A/G-specific adenine glycosylase
MMAAASFSKRLLRWFDPHGRKNLPWQKHPTPYRVWVSEVMLQQTQVSTVIPYFKAFIKQYPTVQALAAAPIDDVLHLWSGLGYYARARNLHKAALVLVHEHNGKFPDTVDALEQLPGIGRSTAGAIVSLAFRQRAVILDGNVKRVLGRHFALPGVPASGAAEKHYWAIAEKLTPAKRVHDYTQAIMDLGATVCTRTRPRCEECPLEKTCLARQHGTQHLFPQKRAKASLPVRETRLLLVVNPAGDVLLQQRPDKGIWGGLWSLPECPLAIDVRHWCQENLGMHVKKTEEREMLLHTFSHFRLRIHPLVIRLAKTPKADLPARAMWYKTGRKSSRKGMAAPVRKLLEQL